MCTWAVGILVYSLLSEVHKLILLLRQDRLFITFVTKYCKINAKVTSEAISKYNKYYICLSQIAYIYPHSFYMVFVVHIYLHFVSTRSWRLRAQPR